MPTMRAESRWTSIKNAMPYLSLLTKGLKRQCGADNRKVPVAIEQILEIHEQDASW